MNAFVTGVLRRAARVISATGSNRSFSGAGNTCAKATSSAATWFGRRAALMYTFRLTTERRLQEQDRLQRTLKADQVPPNSRRWEPWRAMVASLARAVEWHEGKRPVKRPRRT